MDSNIIGIVSPGVNNIEENGNFFQPNFPYNVRPHFRKFVDDGGSPNLLNPPDYSIQSILIKDSNICISQGWETKNILPLNNFFIPVENYIQLEVNLPAHNSSEFLQIDYTNLNGATGVNYLIMQPKFLNLQNLDQDMWKVDYKFINEVDYRSMGSLLFLTSVKQDIQPIQIKNNCTENLQCTIIFGV